MKLNKVLALALSGLMAVSMLAGCSSDPSNGDGGNTEVTPPASDAVSIMNEAQSAVKFEANTDFDAALAAAAKKGAHNQVEGLDFAVEVVTNVDPIYGELDDKLTVDDHLNSSSYEFTTTANSEAGKSYTKTVLYKVNADGLTEKAALEQIAAIMKSNKDFYPDLVWIGNPKANYEASYTGRVSVVTVNTADSGETATAYYIAVSVTQSVARDGLNVAP